MSIDPAQALYAAPLAAIWYYYGRSRQLETARSVTALSTAVDNGLHEPDSLHPWIDPAKCLGCGACVSACPEGDILGIINGRAQLIEPSSCIGHGACKASCPFDAISLVFGSETRGVDLPVVGQDFQTNIPGIYIAGELGGMGLIRNAIEQGRQALDEISRRPAGKSANLLDVIIVGAGPAGFSASLAAKERGMTFKTFDQETLGGTVAHFPRGKLVMTRPAVLPIIGEVKLDRFAKEDLLEFWHDVQHKTGLKFNFNEGVENIRPLDQGVSGFEVTTAKGSYFARSVLLAIGRRGSPRKLDVPGEDLPNVVYRLVDAEQYRGKNVVVVGGGDSAIEAAVSIANEPGTTVTVSYRGGAFARCKPQNREAIQKLSNDGRISVLLNSTIETIAPQSVRIQHDGQILQLKNDMVIICAGGIVPSGFLKTIGIDIETKYGTA
jgi:thioredoxin reductase (NADPH)